MTASRSDLDRHAVDALDEVTGIIERYDPVRQVALDLADFAPKFAARQPRPMRPDRALAMVQGMVMQFCNSADTRIERVSYDTDPLVPGWAQTRNALDVNGDGITQVVFACIPEGTPFFKAGEREAMAVAYYPASTYGVRDRLTGDNITLPSSFDRRGYSHVIRWFGSFTEADDEAQQLIQALRTFARLDPSAEPDAEAAAMQRDRDDDADQGRYEDLFA